MKLLLTSGGFIDTPLLEKSFLELTGNKVGLKVAIIPTAGDPIEWVEEDVGSNKYIAKLLPNKNNPEDSKTYQYFKSHGYHVVIADLKEDHEKLKEKLQNVDVIEVGGGDVNWLLDWAKKSKLDIYLKDLLDKGVVYVGTSAGSMLLNPDIGFTWWGPEEKWEDTDHVGLGIVDFMFQPLHGETDQATVDKLIERKKYMQTVLDYPWKIYLVKDGQAIVVDGDTVEHIGDGVKRCI
jgi:peptidase E